MAMEFPTMSSICFGLVHVVSPPFNIFIIQDFLYIVKGFL